MRLNQGSQASANTGSSASRSSTLLSDVLTLWSFLLKDRPGRILLLLLVIVVAALLEMAMLAAVVPLVSVLMDSQMVEQGAAGSSAPLLGLFGQLSQSTLLGLVVVVVALSAFSRVLVLRMSTEYALAIGMQFQTGYFRIVLNRDYEHVVNQSSSENVSLITQKVQLVIVNYILGVLTTLASVVSGIGVVIVLIWFSKPVVLFALLALAASYVVIARFTRGRLKRYGSDLQMYNPKKIQSIQEGLGGIRDVVMAGNQEQFVDRFAHAARRVETANARIVFYNSVPKPILEALGIGSIAGIAWAAQQGNFSGANLLPLLGVFALGMLRLLPYMQQIFSQWTRLVSGHPVLAELLNELDGFSALAEQDDQLHVTAAIPFNESIALQHVGFSYKNVSTPVLSDIDLTINKGEYIGIVGPTGSGKSTLVDMLMGLLPPSTGLVAIDGQPLNADNRAQWRKRVAHVPQKLFLTQGTIAENIAFGVSAESIDMDRIEQCSRHAHLHEFILGLPAGYETQVGEDGVRLSGGQRQRIGLARALYSDCDVLVLDEATNALDNATELAVVDELLSLDRGYTLIAIAHNLRTVAQCHRIVVVGEGSARWQG